MKCPCCGAPVLHDYDERPRPPTQAELEAHDGIWIFQVRDIAMVVRVMRRRGGEKYLQGRRQTMAGSWRPVTKKLWPVAWPAG